MKGLTHDMARLWRHLRQSGNWWTAQDLYRHWYPVFSQEAVQQMLDYLQRHRFAARRMHIDWGAHAYAVTPDCRALPGFEKGERA